MATKTKTEQPVDDDDCPQCGQAKMVLRRRTLEVPVNRTRVRVPRALHYRCPKCDEVVYAMDQAAELQERAQAVYRARFKLLEPHEITATRTQHHLSQARLAVLIQAEVRLLERWEAGRLVQPPQIDRLLRMLRELPGSLRLLKKFAA